MVKTVLAGYAHGLLDRLGYHENVQVVAHDFGVGVGVGVAYATSADVPGAGHFLMHEAPDHVVAEINAFYPIPTP